MTTTKRKRRKRFITGIVLAAIVVASPGCATRYARTQPGGGRSTAPPAYRDQPHLFPATRYTWDGRVYRHGLHGKISRAVSEETSRRQGSAWLISGDAIFYSLFIGGPVLFVTGVCTFVVELPVSLVSDTLMIPADRSAVRQFEADGAFVEEALLGMGWPVSSEAFRQRYRPVNGNPIIQEFIEQPATPAFSDKVRLLIETEAGLPVLAASAHLDAQMANQLLEQVADEPRHKLALERMSRNPEIPDETLMRLTTRSQSPSHRYLQPLLAANPGATAAHLEALLPAHIQEATLPDDTLTALERIAAHPAVSQSTLARLAESPAPSVFHAVSANPHTPLDALARMADRGIHAAQNALARHPEAKPAQLDALSRLERMDLLSSIAEHPAATADILLHLEKSIDPQSRRGRDLALRLARHPATPNAILERLSQWEEVEIDTALADHVATPPETIALLAERTYGDSMAAHRFARALAANPSTPESFLLAQCEIANTRSNPELRRNLIENPATPSAGLMHFADELRYGTALLQHPNVTPEIVEQVARAACRPGWAIHGDQPPLLLAIEAAAGHPMASPVVVEIIRTRIDEMEPMGNIRYRYAGLLRSIRRNLQDTEARLE